jgi:hypothetical protein
LLAAAARAGDTGEPLLDLDGGTRGQNHEARTHYMAQRLSDQDRYEAAEYGADDLSDPIPPPSQDVYDLDSREDRIAYLSERIEGRGVDPSDTYSSSDIPEEEYE